MPLYEFKCPECGKIIDRLLPIDTKQRIIKCKCGKMAKRIISSTNFQLKGGGWSDSGYSKGEK